MASTITPYDHLWRLSVPGSLNVAVNAIRLRMVTSGYVFNPAHTMWNNSAGDGTNPSLFEVANGDGYVTGGALLSNVLVTDGFVSFDDVVFATLTKTFRALVGVAPGTYDGVVDPLLFYLLPDSTPADIVSSGSNYTVIWNSTNGLFYRPPV